LYSKSSAGTVPQLLHPGIFAQQHNQQLQQCLVCLEVQALSAASPAMGLHSNICSHGLVSVQKALLL
jgi:hypothetical protein